MPITSPCAFLAKEVVGTSARSLPETTTAPFAVTDWIVPTVAPAES